MNKRLSMFDSWIQGLIKRRAISICLLYDIELQAICNCLLFSSKCCLTIYVSHFVVISNKKNMAVCLD